MFKNWYAEGAAAQKWMGQRDTAELQSLGSHPRENSSIPLSAWWIRQDIVLIIYLLRGILSTLVGIGLLLIAMLGLNAYNIIL